MRHNFFLFQHNNQICNHIVITTKVASILVEDSSGVEWYYFRKLVASLLSRTTAVSSTRSLSAKLPLPPLLLVLLLLLLLLLLLILPVIHLDMMMMEQHLIVLHASTLRRPRFSRFSPSSLCKITYDFGRIFLQQTKSFIFILISFAQCPCTSLVVVAAFVCL
jgi:hypothetical protein